MNRLKRLIFLVLVPGVLFSMQSMRILLVGNSITYGVGSTDDLGFRKMFHDSLDTAGYHFEMVGNRGQSPYLGQFKPGARIRDFYVGPGGIGGELELSPVLRNKKPQVVIIHLGTNDIGGSDPIGPYDDNQGQIDSQTSSGKMAELIKYVAMWHTGLWSNTLQTIFVSQIIPSTVLDADRISQFNAEIQKIVDDANAGHIQGIPPGLVRLVDQHSGFDAETLLFDGIHPTDAGYERMAQVLFNAYRFMPMRLKVENRVLSCLTDSDLISPLHLRVTDDYGTGIPDVPVSLSITNGSGYFPDAMIDTTLMTDSQGSAFMPFHMGWDTTVTVRAETDVNLFTEKTFQITRREHLMARGEVHYFGSDRPVPDVICHVIREETDSVVTSENGFFEVDTIFKQQPVSFSFSRRKREGDDQALLSYDAALIARHVVGLDTLAPLAWQAADVNEDSVVALDDAVTIARFAVGFDTPHPQLGQWRFSPDTLAFSGEETDITGMEIQAMVLGDVHSGWQPADPNLVKRQPNRGFWQMGPIEKSGGQWHVPLVVDASELLSFDGVFSWEESLRLVGVESGLPSSFHLSTRTDNRRLALGLFGATPVSGSVTVAILHFEPTGQQGGTELIWHHGYINDQRLEATLVTRVGDSPAGPYTFTLGQAWPNPFNPEVHIPFQLEKRENVNITIFNVLGQPVKTLFQGSQPAGSHRLVWKGVNDQGVPVSSGLYLIRLKAGDRERVQKIQKIE